MMSAPYKDYHIKLMHSNGTTAYETVFVILPSYFSVVTTVLLGSLLSTYITSYKKWQFIAEFFLLIIPIVLSVTVFTKYIKDILIATVVIVINIIILVYNLKPQLIIKPNYTGFNTSFITNARSTINILSVLSILAVDFNIFPRRFAKTETFGYSLMDVGVGLYVYSNGIVAPEVRGYKDSITKSLKSSIVLFILGGTRFLFTKQTDYNVPISEYGVHWNFFITLGVTKIFTSFILNVFNINYICINAIFMITAHEILLQAGLQQFALINVKRDTFILANKEGLVSSLGYVSIYLFSVYFGYLINVKTRGDKLKTCLSFVIGALIALALSLCLQNNFEVSRRLANSPYCFWILFIGILMTGLYYIAQVIQEFIFRNKLPNCMYSPLIFEAVNYNGLLFFLLGNILTGLINLAFNTLTLNDSISLVVIVLYMLLNCVVVCILYCKKIKLKL